MKQIVKMEPNGREIYSFQCSNCNSIYYISKGEIDRYSERMGAVTIPCQVCHTDSRYKKMENFKLVRERRPVMKVVYVGQEPTEQEYIIKCTNCGSMMQLMLNEMDVEITNELYAYDCPICSRKFVVAKKDLVKAEPEERSEAVPILDQEN